MSSPEPDPPIVPPGASSELDVERDSDVPISTQIYWQLAYQIDSGRLLPGSRLPPVRELGAALRRDLHAGATLMAARRFVDYWFGQPRYDTMTTGQQQSIAHRMNAVGAHFSALWNDPASPADYAGIRSPLTILMGTRTRASARRIVELMRAAVSHARFIPLAGLGHLGPLTDAEFTARHIGTALRGHEQRMLAMASRLAA